MHQISVEGSAEICRVGARQHWHAAGRTMQATLHVWLSTLMGDEGRALVARTSSRMARCLACMPLCRWHACLVVVLCVCSHQLALYRCFLGWGVRQRELSVERPRKLAEPREKPGGIGALGMVSCTSHRVQLVASSLTVPIHVYFAAGDVEKQQMTCMGLVKVSLACL